MEITYVDIIGMIGGILIVISFVPQLVIIIHNKSAKDISIVMYLILLAAQLLWVIYGILKNDFQIIITNIITSFINMLIIGFTLYYNTR